MIGAVRTMRLRLIEAIMFAIVVLGLLMAGQAFVGQVNAAACTPPSTDYGTTTMTVSIPATGSYRVWSRMKASSDDASHNSYLLEINGNTCYVVGDSSSGISQDNWTWVDFRDGNTSSKVNHSFSSTGNHTVKLIGREPNVRLDRVIFTQDTSCVPTGTGDNCADPPDTTPPTVSVTAPTNGATVSGEVGITASATDDDSGVEKVEFRVDGGVVGEDSSAPYSFNWDSTTVANGSHSITARAYNNEGLNSVSSSIAVTVNNPAPADLVVTDITYEPADPTTGTEVTFSAEITNEGETATPNGTAHQVTFSIGGQTVSWSDDSTGSLAPGASRIATANDGPSGSETWTAANGAHTVTAHVDAEDTIPESDNDNNTATINLTINDVPPPPDTTSPSVSITAPANNSTVSETITITASASDDVGVTKVEFYVDDALIGGPDSTPPYSASLDTTTLPNGDHTLTAKAFDQADNEATSSSITINVANQTALPEDLNEDGRVNLLDFSLLASKYGQEGAGLGRADINGDGRVNLLDFSLLASKYGQ